ncbi:hypothetical protein BpHYR1_039284 [Brachionus plicatilis]|uniref:Uncharacterized protein n=1 Tax=Brachionus plicatilis TaxID=10195 RepID=A0A3M7QNN8_BRAPC|nr:hypothetical protein BpHYR1_039284 [Brachionus plicatilis]
MRLLMDNEICFSLLLFAISFAELRMLRDQFKKNDSIDTLDIASSFFYVVRNLGSRNQKISRKQNNH